MREEAAPSGQHGVPAYLVVEELHSFFRQLQRHGLQEGDVVRHHLLVVRVDVRRDQVVHVIVGQHVVWHAGAATRAVNTLRHVHRRGVTQPRTLPDGVAHVLQQDADGLDDLHTHFRAAVRLENLPEQRHHVLLTEEAADHERPCPPSTCVRALRRVQGPRGEGKVRTRTTRPHACPRTPSAPRSA